MSVRRGATTNRDPQQAAAELHAALDQPGIRLAVFYCAADYDRPALAAALHARFGDINLIGCTSAGEITPQGYVNGTLTGFSLSAPQLAVATQLIKLDPFDSVVTGAQVAALLAGLGSHGEPPPGPRDTFAFVLIDGLAMQEESLVSCVYAQLQGIELVGGSAADDTRFAATHIYHGGRFHQNVGVLALVRSSLPFIAFRTQHFIKSDTRMVVTRADPARRIVHEINGKPAAREFARLLQLQTEQLTPMIFATHPVVVRIGGQYFVRSIAKVNEDESLTLFCAIDTGLVLTLAQGVDMVQNLQQAFDEVRAAIGPPQLVLGCDCILRRLECERDGIKERIGRIFADNNVIGFATYGEQFNSMHVNQTFTGIAIGQPRGS
jgi:hypothetical protein